MTNATTKMATETTYSTREGLLTRSEIISRATHTDWTKGNVLDLGVVAWYSRELANEINTASSNRDPFSDFC